MSAPPITTTSSDVTSSGQASCKFLDDAEAPTMRSGPSHGPEGRGLRLRPRRESVDLLGIALGLAGLGLVMTVRPRRHRR